MSSALLDDEKQWDSKWDNLPREIRLLILQEVMEDGCPLAPLATVSRKWQTAMERHHFARIRLTPSRLTTHFRAISQRNRILVGYIWFCLGLDEYDCTTDKCPITASFQDLFSILRNWEPHGDLTHDISLYSPSDSKHWFLYLTFLPDTPSNIPDNHIVDKAMAHRDYHNPEHG
ncbi:hypothetical protein CFIO01_05116 [Colletotrichum fioriniae PJ7]|uniref:F-box domain-containing protein n=1 Tax=Colletotrichum fioriniae PJ7 TaxID=1445577 RepID=A0A010QAE0_9PEZI|nr:hypothetical protein CFIO01_05116 [Colletotrichum fioriniae PJ7]